MRPRVARGIQYEAAERSEAASRTRGYAEGTKVARGIPNGQGG